MNKISEIIVILAISSFVSAKLPPSIKVCPRNSTDLAKCFANTVELLRNDLKTGNLGPGVVLEGMEPLPIGDIRVSQGPEMKLIVSDIKAYGISNFKIEKIRVALDPFKIEWIWFIPTLTTRGLYNLKWNVGPLKLQGKGDTQSVIDKVKVVLKMRGSKYLKNGEEFLKMDTNKMLLRYEKITVNFDNLLNGQKDLERIANELINQNFVLFEKDMIGQIIKNMEVKIMKITNDFLEKASYAELFP